MAKISFRLSDAEATELRARAGRDLSAYIRMHLFDRPDPAQLLELILDRVASRAPDGPAATQRSADPVAIETLLLLRVLVQPKDRRTINSSMDRLGLTAFSVDERS